MAKVSIIVPIYNVQEYLCTCIESVLRQTYQDFELILVDDGSSDNCGAICDEYAGKDSRIHVIHQENGGPSAARNAGLHAATGKYIYFLDSDDFIDPKLLDTIVAHMETGMDMVVFDHRDFFEDGTTNVCKKNIRGYLTLHSPQERYSFLTEKLLTYKIGWTVWNRMFRRDVIEMYGLRFADDRKIFAEDLYFCLCYCAHINHILSIDDCLYYYRQRVNSIMAGQKGRLNIGRYNELGKAVLAHFQEWEDCRYLAENFYTIHYMIVTAHFLGAYYASGLSVPEFKKLVVENIEDWDFYSANVKQQLRNWRRSKPGFAEAEYMEQLCYMYFMMYDSYTIHRILVKLYYMLLDRFDKEENP